MKRLKELILWGGFYTIYVAKSLLLLDPDFGWHIRLGQLYIQKGIQYTDPLSYSMKSYPFIDHEWLTNILLYLGYHSIGFIGLSLIFGLFVLVALYLQIYQYPLRWYGIPFLLVATTFVSFLGVRTQVLTWLFFSFLLWIIIDEKRYQRLRLGIPLLILSWVNIHGGFAIGIGILGITMVVRFIKHQFHITDAIVFLASLAVTGINPYGYRIWWEIWMQMSDSSLHWRIAEWFPAFTYSSSFALWLFFALAAVFIYQYRKKFSMLKGSLFCILLLLGISSIRHMPFWLLTALPMTTSAIYSLFKEAQHHPLSSKHFTIAYRVLLGIGIVVMLTELTYDYIIATSFREQSFYPQKAVVYLRTHPTKGNIFSHYNYGGYLDWKLPGKRVFIDGRMPSWRWTAPNTHESGNAFVDWQKIGEGQIPFSQAMEKYNIDTVLWFPINMHPKETLYDLMTHYLEKFLHIKGSNDSKFIDGLKKNGFHMVYEDKTAVIYRISD